MQSSAEGMRFYLLDQKKPTVEDFEKEQCEKNWPRQQGSEFGNRSNNNTMNFYLYLD